MTCDKNKKNEITHQLLSNLDENISSVQYQLNNIRKAIDYIKNINSEDAELVELMKKLDLHFKMNLFIPYIEDKCSPYVCSSFASMAYIILSILSLISENKLPLSCDIKEQIKHLMSLSP